MSAGDKPSGAPSDVPGDGPPDVPPAEPSDGPGDVRGDAPSDVPPAWPEDEQDAVRAELVRAAATVFAREGYAGTRIMDIVREAGVSTGTVYGRFRSKNDLLREAVVRASTRGGVLAGTAGSLGDLVRFAAGLADRPLYPFEALRLEAYVTARREPEVAAAVADAYDQWRDQVAPLVAAAREAGELGDVDPEAVLFLYRTLYLGMLLHRASGLAGPEGAGWDDLVERLVAGLGPSGDGAADADAAVGPDGDGPARGHA